MSEVKYLKKDDKVGSGSYAYSAISEEKVTETIRTSLVKHGLVIFPVKQDHKRDDYTTVSTDEKGRTKESFNHLATVDVTYRIVDIDSGESIEVVSSGTGVDPQDKAVGKAMTYAYKYMLLRTFAIPTGEDPDKIASTPAAVKKEVPAEKTPAKPSEKPAENPAPATEETKDPTLLTTKQLNKAAARIEAGEIDLVEKLQRTYTISGPQAERLDQAVAYAKRMAGEKMLSDAIIID